MSKDEDRPTPVPERAPNGTDREVLEFLLDPDNPDPKLLVRVVQKTYAMMVDTRNEVGDMRALVLDVSGTQKVLARALGIDLEKEALRKETEARSVPPLRELAKRVAKVDAEVAGVREELPSYREVDEKVLGELAETTSRLAALSKDQADIELEQAELKKKQAQQDRIVRASLVRGIPKLVKIGGSIAVALGALLLFAQQAWIQCGAGKSAPTPPVPAAPTPPAAPAASIDK